MLQFSIASGVSRIWLCLAFFALSVGSKLANAAEANELFSSYNPALVQIKTVNIESGQKSSIGTGFFINIEGRIVTNYHVISNFIQSPELYRLEFLDNRNQTFPVKVLNIDVINDLAILEADKVSETYFSLAQQAPIKGKDIFALGNPHDLGMIVVPGTYNGIKINSFYDRIHFTGSINPGMSGGPTVDELGRVVGINVATAGNQIGFLVPVEKLHNLIAESANLITDSQSEQWFKTRITTQLTDNQASLYANIINTEWPLYTLGQAFIPNQVSDFMPCWGSSNKDKEKAKYTVASSNCGVDERIYLSGNMTTGVVQMSFSWVHSDELNQLQLGQLFSASLNSRYGHNNGSEDEVTDFHCDQAIIGNTFETISKGVTCVRAYRKYDGLYDVRYHSLLLEKDNQTLIGRYALQGVTRDTAQDFYKKYMENVKWK